MRLHYLAIAMLCGCSAGGLIVAERADGGTGGAPPTVEDSPDASDAAPEAIPPDDAAPAACVPDLCDGGDQ